MFVGTKRQAQETIKEEALRCGQFYINQRWLGGLMTNFPTIRKRVQRMLEIRKYDEEEDGWDKFTKKEAAAIRKEQIKLEKYLGGIAKMTAIPDAIFLIDPRREENAIAEAKRLGIPVVSIVDTNCDPEMVDYPIPGTDDAIRAIKLVTSLMANAVIEGSEGKDALFTDDEAAQAEAEAMSAQDVDLIEMRERLHEAYEGDADDEREEN